MKKLALVTLVFLNSIVLFGGDNRIVSALSDHFANEQVQISYLEGGSLALMGIQEVMARKKFKRFNTIDALLESANRELSNAKRLLTSESRSSLLSGHRKVIQKLGASLPEEAVLEFERLGRLLPEYSDLSVTLRRELNELLPRGGTTADLTYNQLSSLAHRHFERKTMIEGISVVPETYRLKQIRKFERELKTLNKLKNWKHTQLSQGFSVLRFAGVVIIGVDLVNRIVMLMVDSDDSTHLEWGIEKLLDWAGQDDLADEKTSNQYLELFDAPEDDEA